MLVLERKKGEGFLIGNNVYVKVVKIKGHSVQLGIEAPKNVKVLRDDVNFPYDKSLDVVSEIVLEAEY